MTEARIGAPRTGAARWLLRLDVPIVIVVVGIIASLLQSNLQFLVVSIAIYALFALSTNMLVGWLGIISFGQAAFFGGGSYFAAVLRLMPINPLLVLLLAGLFGAALAAVFSLVTLRVNGIALTMLTLVLGQVLYQVIYTVPSLGGDNGIPGVPSGELFGLLLANPSTFLWYALIIVGICVLAIRLISRSSFGRSVVAARDDPIRADALGMPVRGFRTALFVLSGFFASIAGALYAQQQGIVTSDSVFWLTSGTVLIMCLVGGTKYFWGPAVGALVIQFLNTQLFNGISFSGLFIGLILLAVVLVFRQGLVGLPGQVKDWTKRLRRNRRPHE